MNPLTPHPTNETPSATTPEDPLATPPDPEAADAAPPPDPNPDPLQVHAALSAAEAASLGLSPAQRTAIEKLTAGHTLSASASAAGVNRSTLYRWLKQDLPFLAAYHAWQHDAIATARTRLLALTDTAVTTLGSALAKGDGRLALRLLERLGLTDRPTPGSTDAADLQAEQTLEHKRQVIEKRKEADRLFWDGVMHPPDFAEAAAAEEEAEAAAEEKITVRYKRLE